MYSECNIKARVSQALVRVLQSKALCSPVTRKGSLVSVQVGDLQYASPATVSRCGMVFVDSRNLGYMPFVSTWLTSRYATNIQSLTVILYACN